jgi:phage baseplate assembly protein W
MQSEFLGTGWRFPLEFDESGVRTAGYEDSVQQSIWIILGTAPGERQMRPEFGCGIHNLVFAPNTPGTASLAEMEVRQALSRWEPRIDVSAVRVTSDAGGERLLIDIEYRLRATNSRFNLVYPFYLQHGGG